MVLSEDAINDASRTFGDDVDRKAPANDGLAPWIGPPCGFLPLSGSDEQNFPL